MNTVDPKCNIIFTKEEERITASLCENITSEKINTKVKKHLRVAMRLCPGQSSIKVTDSKKKQIAKNKKIHEFHKASSNHHIHRVGIIKDNRPFA